MQHKDDLQEPINQTENLSCCHYLQGECTSRPSYETIRQKLLDAGLPEERFLELMGFFKAFAQRFVDQAFPLTRHKTAQSYEQSIS